MTHISRVVAYTRQTGKRQLTPAQRRRARHKRGRAIAAQARQAEQIMHAQRA